METRQEGSVEKQIGGCMGGFFNIFDRPHILSPKRLSSSLKTSAESESESERSSPVKQPTTPSIYSTPELRSPAPWRFCKEAPRLSLDSRAVVDAKGSLKPRQQIHGSPSVVARLMGLEALPSQQQQPLQRCASESRVSRFADSFNFQNAGVRSSARAQKPARAPPPPPPQHRCIVRPKSFFDSADFFPEPRKKATTKTLKQLPEALRLKGLLHSSPINPAARSRGHLRQSRDSSPRSRSGVSPSARDRGGYARARSTSQNGVKSPNRRPTLNEQRRWRRPEPLHTRGPGGEDHQCTTLAAADQEMWKVDNYYNRQQGKTLLDRCDKLLHSISEMAASEAGPDSQPSPVSVLDASLYHDDSSPSPVMKRTLHFPESEDESWGGSIVSVSPSSDSEYIYISDILRASDCLPQDSDVFSFLEKQQYLKGKCSSRAAAQERRLIFDAVQEIVGRRKRLPPWRMVGEGDQMQAIWSEFQRIKQQTSARDEEDLLGYVSGVLGRDLSEDRWRDCPLEMSEAVLDIERLIFKDVIGETILNLAALNRSHSLRRRLVF